MPRCRKKKVAQANRPLGGGQLRGRWIRLLGGTLLWATVLYYAPRPGKRRSAHGSGLYPELAVFGFHDGDSSALVSHVARQVTLLPSFALARQELARGGLDLDIKTVHGITHHLGHQFLVARRIDLELYRTGRMPAGTQMAGKRVVAQLDGGRIRLRKVRCKQKGKGKKKTQKRRYRGEWREPKLLIVFEIDHQGRKVEKSRAQIDGTFAGPDEVMELLAMHLHRLGAAAAEVVVFVADGAPWIWDRLPWIVKRVGLDSNRVAYALDWCHALHHVGLALATAGLPGKEHQRVFKKMRKWLKQGYPGRVVNELERLGQEHGVSKAMKTPLGYLRKHMKAGHLDYGKMRRRGLPIGSGGIESTIRRVINLRLKGNGQMWREENAEGLILLRAAALTDRWDETVQQAQQCKDANGCPDWIWSSPDMPLQLKAKLPIGTPVPQLNAA